MATLSKAFRVSTYYNPLTCHSKNVSSIVIFQDGKIIAQNKQGWLTRCGFSSNNDDLTVFNDILFHNKRVINLDFPHSFMAKNALYINAKDLPDFEHIGEQVALSTEKEKQYGDFISFTTGDKSNATPRPFKCMMGGYTRCEKTALGKQLDEVYEFINDLGVDLARYDTKAIIDNKDELIKFLSELN